MNRIFAAYIYVLALLLLLAISVLAGCGCESEDSDGNADDDDDSSDDDSSDDDDSSGDDDSSDDDDSGDDDDWPSGDVTVDPPPVGNPLARRVIVRTSTPCRLSGFITSEGEAGYAPSSPVISTEGTNHVFWFFGLLEDRDFAYTFYTADKAGDVVAHGGFSTGVLPGSRPELSEFDYHIEAGLTDWYMVYYNYKNEGVVLNLVYDRLGRIRLFHPAESGQFPQVMPNGEIVATTHTRLVSVLPEGKEYTLFSVDLDQPVLRHTHHKFFLESVDAGWAMVVFGRYGPGVECDLVTPTEYAVGDGIAQIDAAGNEVWRWDVFDHTDRIPPDAVSPVLCEDYFWGPGTTDWTHGNAVEPIPGENAYLVSYRNVSRVLKVNRDTGDLEWQMGPGLDFTWVGSEPEDEKWFYFQHDPHWLSGDRFLVYDNNKGSGMKGDKADTFSRVLELQVDTDAMTVEQIWEYRFPHHTPEGNAERNANGNTLVSSGSGRYVVELPPGGGQGDEYIKMRFAHGILRAEYYPPFWLESDPPIKAPGLDRAKGNTTKPR